MGFFDRLGAARNSGRCSPDVGDVTVRQGDAVSVVATTGGPEDCSSQRVLMPEVSAPAPRANERTPQVGIEALLLVQPSGPP